MHYLRHANRTFVALYFRLFPRIATPLLRSHAAAIEETLDPDSVLS